MPGNAKGPGHFCPSERCQPLHEQIEDQKYQSIKGKLKTKHDRLGVLTPQLQESTKPDTAVKTKSRTDVETLTLQQVDLIKSHGNLNDIEVFKNLDGFTKSELTKSSDSIFSDKVKMFNNLLL